MCIAIPGRIVSIDGNKAKADFNGNLVDVNVGIIEPKIGDYVLVHAGCAIEVMARSQAEELISLFAEIEEAENRTLV